MKVAGADADGAALRYPDSPIEALRDLVRLDWASMSEWFEEDEPVYTHPRDPYSRVDILASSRHVRVEIDGVTVADSGQPRILFETGLPPRYYLPLTDLRMDLLRPSDTQTHCPYKGTAAYWSVDTGQAVHTDIVWIYRTPLPESQKVAGLACLYNEKVDIYLDGELQERPQHATSARPAAAANASASRITRSTLPPASRAQSSSLQPRSSSSANRAGKQDTSPRPSGRSAVPSKSLPMPT